MAREIKVRLFAVMTGDRLDFITTMGNMAEGYLHGFDCEEWRHEVRARIVPLVATVDLPTIESEVESCS